MDPTILISILGSAVAASCVTGFINWRIKVREEKYEQVRWVREKRYVHYLDLLDFSKSLQDDDDKRNYDDRSREMRDYLLKTQLIGSVPVLTALFNLDLENYHSGFRADQTEFEVARKELQLALREDLDIWAVDKAPKRKRSIRKRLRKQLVQLER